jgi:hypothetical protein
MPVRLIQTQEIEENQNPAMKPSPKLVVMV